MTDVLRTKCPKCQQPMPFALVEERLEDGGLVCKSRPCAQCGFSAEIGRLTKRGVEVRAELANLRRMNSRPGHIRRRIRALEDEYEKNYTPAELVKG